MREAHHRRPSRPRAHTQVQPVRVNETTTGRKKSEGRRPYEARKPQPRGPAGGDRPARERARPARYNFVVELKDLIAVPNIAVSSRIRALTKSRSKSTPGVKVNTRRRLGEETPSSSVAKARRRLGEGVAQPGHRQDQISLRQGNHSGVPRYPWVGKTMEGATPWEDLKSR